MGQNALCQSDCSIYKRPKFPEEMNNLIDNFMGGNGKKWVWSIWLRDSKIEFISGMNSWNKLVFCLMLQI